MLLILSNITRAEKISLAKAILVLLPTYKVESSVIEGIDLFYDPSKNSGYIASKLKNVNIRRFVTEGPSAKKRFMKCAPLSTSDKNSENTTLDPEDEEFFANCNAIDQEDAIKLKLQTTVDIRSNIFKSPVNIFKKFPFYFFNATLIDFNFKIRYLAAGNLCDSWDSIAIKIEKVALKMCSSSLPDCASKFYDLLLINK